MLIANNSPDFDKPLCLNVTFAGRRAYAVAPNDADKLRAQSEDDAAEVPCHQVFICPGQAAYFRVEQWSAAAWVLRHRSYLSAAGTLGASPDHVMFSASRAAVKRARARRRPA
ncbi:MAG TPA: hypothetical protein VNA25_18295, partial [Phycisphaerae bacterium]|nr:hypothetical protein [Phycisphaerae bacterium]